MTERGSVTLERTAPDHAHIVLRRRSRRNALDPEMIAALDAVLGEAEELGPTVVTLRGEGPEAFCAGADVDTLGSLDEESARAFIASLHRALARLRGLDAVTVAVVSGHCIGAGLELAVSCDLRVADATAAFSMPEVLVGIPSVIEAALIPSVIGWGRSADLLLTGRTVGAEEAERIGLVQRLAPAGALDAVVEGLLQELRAAGPGPLAAQKRLLRRWQSSSLEDGITAGIDSLAEAYRAPEGEEAEPVRRLRLLRERRRRSDVVGGAPADD